MNPRPAYTSITIIYNPNSTGSGKTLAEELRAKLGELMPGRVVTLTPTKHAGHGEELAYKLARATPRALVISASGDGGYHEVVNGLMKAARTGATPVAGLLPAGNANDHFRNVHDEDVAGAIAGGREQRIDLLKLTTTSHGHPLERYAHSYIGIGLTPKAGHQLNQTQLNRLNEIWIVLKVLFWLRPVRLMVDGHAHAYDSLIFSNISSMSKVLSLSDAARPNDGKFEVTAFRRRNKLKLISSLLKAATVGLNAAGRTTEYGFETIKPTLVQLDGEITTIDARAGATIELESSALTCII